MAEDCWSEDPSSTRVQVDGAEDHLMANQFIIKSFSMKQYLMLLCNLINYKLSPAIIIVSLQQRVSPGVKLV